MDKRWIETGLKTTHRLSTSCRPRLTTACYPRQEHRLVGVVPRPSGEGPHSGPYATALLVRCADRSSVAATMIKPRRRDGDRLRNGLETTETSARETRQTTKHTKSREKTATAPLPYRAFRVFCVFRSSEKMNQLFLNRHLVVARTRRSAPGLERLHAPSQLVSLGVAADAGVAQAQIARDDVVDAGL